MDQRLPDVGIDVPWQAAEPCFHGVHRLADGGEALGLDNPFDGADFFGCGGAVFIPDRHGLSQVTEADMIATQFLQGFIGILRLVAASVSSKWVGSL